MRKIVHSTSSTIRSARRATVLSRATSTVTVYLILQKRITMWHTNKILVWNRYGRTEIMLKMRQRKGNGQQNVCIELNFCLKWYVVWNALEFIRRGEVRLPTRLSYPVCAVRCSLTNRCTWLVNWLLKVKVTALPFVVGTKLATNDVGGGGWGAGGAWWCAGLAVKSPARRQTSIIWTEALTLLQCA